MDFSKISLAISIVVGLLAIVNGYATLRQRKIAPNEERWSALMKWQADVDAKLHTDNMKIKHFEREFDKNEEFQRVMLQSTKGMLDHFTSGNHVEEMKRISASIDDFLINR